MAALAWTLAVVAWMVVSVWSLLLAAPYDGFCWWVLLLSAVTWGAAVPAFLVLVVVRVAARSP